MPANAGHHSPKQHPPARACGAIVVGLPPNDQEARYLQAVQDRFRVRGYRPRRPVRWNRLQHQGLRQAPHQGLFHNPSRPAIPQQQADTALPHQH